MADKGYTEMHIFVQSALLDSQHVSLSELESQLEHVLRRAGRDHLQHRLEALEEQNPAHTTRCRWCGDYACYASNRIGFARSRFGLIRYRRAYYICPFCHRSTCPLDERLDPYASLSRLREQINAGFVLPVDELASAWGLGSLEADNFEITAGREHFRNYRHFLSHGGLPGLLNENSFLIEKKKIISGGNLALLLLSQVEAPDS